MLKKLAKRVASAVSMFRQRHTYFDAGLTFAIEGTFFLLSNRLPGGVSEKKAINSAVRAIGDRKKYVEMLNYGLSDEEKRQSISQKSIGVGNFCSRLLDATDISLPDFKERFHDLGFLEANQHRKDWEKTYVSMLVDHYKLSGESVRCLGVGVGTEVLIYHFSNVCGKVVATDIYESSSWSSAAKRVDQVYDSSPINYRRSNLEVRSMDMKNLDFQSSSFNFIWSISAIEHLSTIDEIVEVFKSFARLLVEGGYAFITTEWNLIEGNPRYSPGCIIFDDALVSYICKSVPELSLIGPILTEQSKSDLHIYNSDWQASNGKEIPPLYNILSNGTFITPVALVFQKRGDGLKALE